MIIKNHKLFVLLLSYSMLVSVFTADTKTLFIAHGCRPDIYSEECTKASLGKAVNAGISAIECDLAKSRDGVIVLLHPGRLENREVTTQLAPGERYIHLTLQELRIAKPMLMTLEELLRETPNNIIIFLDFKENNGLEEETARLVEQCIKAGFHTNAQFYALGWNDTVLLKFKQLLPFVKIFPVFLDTTDKNVEYYQSMHADGVVLINRVPGAITAKQVTKLKAAGFKLLVLQPQDGPKETLSSFSFDAILADSIVEYVH